jgi:hypothetical protein
MNNKVIKNNIGFESINNIKPHADFLQSTSVHPKLNITDNKADMLDVVSFAPFLMWNEHDSKYFENVGTINTLALNDNNVYDPIGPISNPTYADLMRDTFFSAENMDIIQNMIIKDVYIKSGETLRINKIKSESLLQCMNHMWTNFCRFLPYDFKEQIADINRKVTDYLVPLLLKESEFYFNYLRDSNRTELPQLERPIMIVKGRKQQLPSFYR